MDRSQLEKPPLRWVGVLFAVVVNLLLVTLADLAINQLGLIDNINTSVALRLVAPLIAGMLTALYVGSRGGIHRPS